MSHHQRFGFCMRGVSEDPSKCRIRCGSLGRFRIANVVIADQFQWRSGLACPAPCPGTASALSTCSTYSFTLVTSHVILLPSSLTGPSPDWLGGFLPCRSSSLSYFSSICRCFSIWFCLIRIHSSCLPIANFPCVMFTPGKSRPRNWGS